MEHCLADGFYEQKESVNLMKKVFIFLGPPGCGKGTQTDTLSRELNIPHIDTGSLLRENIKNETQFGKIAKSFIDKGQLVPIEVVASVIKDRISKEDCKNGYILDGFPRSMEQAQALKDMWENTPYKFEKSEKVAVYFDIPTDVLVERLINRRSCPVCGKIYNLKSSAPKVENKCDICNIELIQRKDDTKETAVLRFETYNRETKPLLDFYKNDGILVQINANQGIDAVYQELKKVIND